MQKLTIPGRLDGLNEIIKANRTNLYLGAKLKKDNEKVVTDCITIYRLHPETEPVFLKFTWVEPNRKRDKDNIASAKKMVLDALVQTQILSNDGWKNIIGFSDAFEIDKENPRIELEIIPESELKGE